MSTPVADIPQPPYPSRVDSNHSSVEDDEGTVDGAADLYKISQQFTNESARQTREQQYRLDDDLAMLHAERVVSAAQVSQRDVNLTHSMSMHNTRSKREEPLDAFDAATNPIHEKTARYKPPEHPTTKVGRVFKRVHNSSYLVRYFIYILPVVMIFLIPLLLGALLFQHAAVGGVRLLWFSVWLEIVWLTLWAGRIVAKALPYPIGLFSSLFTNNSKKWRDMGKQLEVPATIFFWALAVEISFLPTMTNHHLNTSKGTQSWEATMNKCLASLLILATLNFIEKIIIQLIAISFHLRTYADRIELNKFQIGSLTKLYQYSKDKIAMEDSDFEEGSPSGPASGARTPMQYLTKAQKNARGAFSKVGDVAGKVAGDFMGRQVANSTHPHQVVLTLLNSPSGSQVLARRLWRTFVKEDADTVDHEDLKHSFDNDDEAEAAFTMFDKDLNGDISMEELEAVCVEIGRERKSITASLKDLDSVVSKLDAVLFFVVVVITVLVFISLISTSAAGVLGSAGSAVLGLSWLFSATAQDFLQSVMFVLVKHPFDVGDRVSIYGNTGVALKGDDYFVKEISLLYTEFKKMEGHVVQAPNNYLNTLFILNQRRSGGLAEAVPLTVKFGTTLDQVDQLRQRLLEFVKEEKREYQGNILTEIRDIIEAHSLNLNVVFFYKSNWQNELLRLQRRNKFICALMVCMQELGIEGPRMRIPGQREDSPFYVQNAPQHIQDPEQPFNNHTGLGKHRSSLSQERPFVTNAAGMQNSQWHDSTLRHTSNTTRSTRPRGESVSAMSKRVDFSLGMRDVSSGDLMGDIFEERIKQRVPDFSQPQPGDRRSGSMDGASMRHGSQMGRTTSRENEGTSHAGLHRASTESQTRLVSSHSGIHRNRLFRRNRQQSSAGVNTDLMEQGMADIPENGIGQNHIDARTGTISSQTMRVRSEDNATVPGIPTTSVNGRLPPWEEISIGSPPTRSHTAGIEMQRYK